MATNLKWPSAVNSVERVRNSLPRAALIVRFEVVSTTLIADGSSSPISSTRPSTQAPQEVAKYASFTPSERRVGRDCCE